MMLKYSKLIRYTNKELCSPDLMSNLFNMFRNINIQLQVWIIHELRILNETNSRNLTMVIYKLSLHIESTNKSHHIWHLLVPILEKKITEISSSTSMNIHPFFLFLFNFLNIINNLISVLSLSPPLKCICNCVL